MRQLETRRPIALPAGVLGVVVVGGAALAIGRRLSNPHDAAVATLLIMVAGMIAASVLLVPLQALPAPRADQEAALAELPQAHVARSKAMHGAMHRVGYAAVSVGFTLDIVMGFTPVGSTLISRLVGLPFAVLTHRVTLRFKLSTQTWRAWAIDQVKMFIVASIMMGLIFAAIYTAIGLSPDWWWLWASCVLIVIMAIYGFVYPIWIAPLFNKHKPLEEGSLRTRIMELARRDEVKLDEIYVIDASRRTTAHNAAVAGYGRTRRVLLFDTLFAEPTDTGPAGEVDYGAVAERLKDTTLRGATEDQIVTIVAHEFAHAKFQDVIAGMVFGFMQITAVFCGLFLLNDWKWLLDLVNVTALTDPKAVALFLGLMGVAGLIMGPYAAVMSRRREASADWHALVLTNDAESFEDAWRRIVEVNLADPNPNRVMHALFGSHPAIAKRMAMARAYRRLCAK